MVNNLHQTYFTAPFYSISTDNFSVAGSAKKAIKKQGVFVQRLTLEVLLKLSLYLDNVSKVGQQTITKSPGIRSLNAGFFSGGFPLLF
jgi:hypothetical protein